MCRWSITAQPAFQLTKLHNMTEVSVSERAVICQEWSTCVTTRICCSLHLIRPRVTKLRYLSRRSVCCGRAVRVTESHLSDDLMRVQSVQVIRSRCGQMETVEWVAFDAHGQVHKTGTP